MEQLGYFLIPFSSIKMVFLIIAGTFAGIYIGAIPGLSVTMAVSVLISFTFTWDLNEALCLMAGIYCGGVYGGSRSAILLNIPGAPAAVATGFDGYPLAKLGEAGIAIGLSTTASVIGGYIGILALATCAPIISEYALLFASRDYFLLAIMGLLLVGSLASDSLAKGIFAGALGVWLSMIGMDTFTGSGEVHLRKPGAHERDPLRGDHDRPLRRLGGPRPDPRHPYPADEAERQEYRPLLAAALQTPPPDHQIVPHRDRDRRPSRGGRRHRGPDGLRERPPEHQESDAALRPGGLRGGHRPRDGEQRLHRRRQHPDDHPRDPR